MNIYYLVGIKAIARRQNVSPLLCVQQLPSPLLEGYHFFRCSARLGFERIKAAVSGF